MEHETIKKWEKDGIKYHIMHTWLPETEGLPSSIYGKLDYRCGYCEFDKPPLSGLEDDAVHEVDVHGGITYGYDDLESVEFGFDCCHADDENSSYLKDIDWLTQECERMAHNILAVVNGTEQDNGV